MGRNREESANGTERGASAVVQIDTPILCRQRPRPRIRYGSLCCRRPAGRPEGRNASGRQESGNHKSAPFGRRQRAAKLDHPSQGSTALSASRALDQINKDNVKNLQVAWTMQLGGVEGGGIWTHGGLEGTPIAENGFSMSPTAGARSTRSTRAAARARCCGRWTRRPTTTGPARSPAAASITAASALYNDLVISHTLDGRLIATDKETGQVKWQRQVANPDKGEVVTGAPLIVKNMAITGVAGAEYGIRGWIAATDLDTQKEVWRTYTHPRQGRSRHRNLEGQRPARKSTGGGSTWVTGILRSGHQHDLSGASAIRDRTGTTPIGPGDNLYTDSIARARRRHRQDQVALPAYAERPLRLRLASPRTCWSTSTARSSRCDADRNGFGYAVDRTNGKFVWATPFVKKVTWTKGIDPETGKPEEYDPEARRAGLQRRRRRPSRDKQYRRHLPRQHGRQELAADRLQPRCSSSGTFR